MADRIIQMKDNQGNNLFPLVKISPSILEGNYLPITGGTLTGDLILKGDPTSLLMPATKQYVDGNFLTNTDALNLFYTKEGSNSKFMAKADYENKYLLLTGGTMSGSLYMNSTKIKSNMVEGGTWIQGSHNGAFEINNVTSAQAGQFFQSWFSGKTPVGAWGVGPLSGSDDLYFVFGTDANYNANNNTTNNIRFGSNGIVWGAVWNDYAEYREADDDEPGRVVMEDKKGVLQRATKRLQSFAGVVSDTFGFSEGETDEAKTPLAVAGRVLVYPYRPREEYNPGDCVCAAPDGTVDIMTRQEIRDWPDRIVGTVSEIPDYKTWGTGNVEVNGRIWIKVR